MHRSHLPTAARCLLLSPTSKPFFVSGTDKASVPDARPMRPQGCLLLLRVILRHAECSGDVRSCANTDVGCVPFMSLRPNQLHRADQVCNFCDVLRLPQCSARACNSASRSALPMTGTSWRLVSTRSLRTRNTSDRYRSVVQRELSGLIAHNIFYDFGFNTGAFSVRHAKVAHELIRSLELGAPDTSSHQVMRIDLLTWTWRLRNTENIA